MLNLEPGAKHAREPDDLAHARLPFGEGQQDREGLHGDREDTRESLKIGGEGISL